MAISVEISLQECSLEFSVLPCRASGTPCYNTRGTCQDVPNFTPETVPLTLRLQSGEDLIATDRPYLLSIEHTSQQLQPEGISDFADRIDLQIQDAPSLDDQDRYDRPAQGTWWPRFLARHPYLVGRPAKVNIDGVQTIWEVASVGYPDGQGIARMTLQAPIVRLFETMLPQRNEILRLREDVDTDRDAGIQPSALPIDIPFDYYRIGGEIIDVNPDGLGAAFRALFGTSIQAHARGDELTPVFVFGTIDFDEGVAGVLTRELSIPRIAFDLIRIAGGGDYLRLEDFENETRSGLELRAISFFIIAEATSVKELLSGFLPLAPMTVHWDAKAGRIIPRALTPWALQAREIRPDEIVNFIDGNRRMPAAVLRSDLNATRVFVRYGKRTPVDDELLGTAVAVNLDAEGPNLFGRTFERNFESPLVQLHDRQLAESAAQRILRRRSSPTRPPIEIAWAMTQGPDLPQIGEVVDLTLPDTLQTIEGAPALTRAQITSARMRPVQGLVEFRALSYRPDIETDADIVLNVTGSHFGYDIFNQAGEPTMPIRVLVRLSRARVGSPGNGRPAMIGVGFHPDSEITIELDEDSDILGHGGSAGNAPVLDPLVQNGGPALRAGSAAWSIEGEGTIGGGGGAGRSVGIAGAQDRPDGLFVSDATTLVIGGGGGAGVVGGRRGSSSSLVADGRGRLLHEQGDGPVTLPESGTARGPGVGGTYDNWRGGIGGEISIVRGNSGAGGDLGEPGGLPHTFYELRGMAIDLDQEPHRAGAAIERQLGAVVQIAPSITLRGEIREV